MRNRNVLRFRLTKIIILCFWLFDSLFGTWYVDVNLELGKKKDQINIVCVLFSFCLLCF